LGRKSWSFDLRYLLGRPPWDTAVTPPELVELVEGGGLPPGRALDLGCGTGTNCIYLARHGWEVVGVDFSILAIRRARRKARWAGVDCRFYRGDVTDLVFLTDPFDLALDIGCLHSLPSEGWERYAAGVARLVLPGGLCLLYAFTSRPDRPTPRGVAPEEVRSLFTPAFAVEREERGEDPSGLRSAWYWLRRLYPLQA
jgi:cyclopropane fatty-acyl-phospholipid synthase-like methyltransferase